jgi:hypothetical protein
MLFWFGLQLLSKTFLILGKFSEILSWMFVGFHIKYIKYMKHIKHIKYIKYLSFFWDFNQTWIFSINFQKIISQIW